MAIYISNYDGGSFNKLLMKSKHTKIIKHLNRTRNRRERGFATLCGIEISAISFVKNGKIMKQWDALNGWRKPYKKWKSKVKIF